MLEMFQLDFIVQAFVVSIIIGVVLSYLGVHVVGRGIVFVDLALGQISSLGVAVSDYMGYGKTIIPIAFALTGALLMSLINIRDKRLKVEAIIGIIYAVASAATVMLISKTPHGDSDIQEVLFGNILSVDWAQIKLVGIIFGAIGLVHFIFYKKFYLLTESFEDDETNTEAIAFRKNKLFRLWNFIFYISIGLAIVFAVRTSGVIPVFSFLIIPAVGAIMLAKNNLRVTIFAVIISLVGAYFGLFVSFHYDFPAGSSLVAVLGGLFLLISIFYFIRNRSMEKKT
ncbi:MAG: metal ABC transporter permease [Saprospiraceae bacterium]|uniref:Metal ABC transporter permease n=1 Tax=Candidatus Opimibacter skivensis TaxID=2982028 RepID=A0A9D7SS16_9BACT|nr:metal ABC transporter permease [Candidatus Opimibacter skivensis]